MVAAVFRAGLRPSLRPLIAARAHVAGFHGTSPALVKAGDALPSVDMTEGAPDKKVNLAKELGKGSGKALVIGVPAAFSRSFFFTVFLSHSGDLSALQWRRSIYFALERLYVSNFLKLRLPQVIFMPT